jgi:hypothetical protein
VRAQVWWYHKPVFPYNKENNLIRHKLLCSQVSMWLLVATGILVAWSCYVTATKSYSTAQQMGTAAQSASSRQRFNSDNHWHLKFKYISTSVLSLKNKTNKLHGAKSFIGRQQLLNHPKNSQHFMEPEGSILWSQEITSGPCPEPEESSPWSHILFLENKINS